MKEPVKETKVHPVAALFPTMSDEELQALAADIQAKGLIHPIIVDDHNQVVDGRNRLSACKIAKVEPQFEQLNGRDPAANLARRNLTKGQQAMVLAMIHPEAEKGGRGKNGEARKAAVSAGFASRRLAEARSVLRHSGKLAKDVLKATTTLDEALEVVKEENTKTSAQEAKLERLRKGAPDLFDRVTNQGLTLDEATALYHDRLLKQKQARESAGSAFITSVNSLVTLSPSLLAWKLGRNSCSAPTSWTVSTKPTASFTKCSGKENADANEKIIGRLA